MLLALKAPTHAPEACITICAAGGGGLGGAAALPRRLHRRLERRALQYRRQRRGLGARRLPILPLGAHRREVSIEHTHAPCRIGIIIFDGTGSAEGWPTA